MRPPSTTNRDNWPPDYVSVWQWRQQQLILMRDTPHLIEGAKAYYATRPVEFINHWVDTYDPRNAGTETPARIPLVCFPRQDDLITFLQGCLRDQEGGLIEKARDMGATWICVGFSVWLWLFWDGAAVGWGSRKQDLVDRIGDMDSIFEKIRAVIRGLPKCFLPVGLDEKQHLTYMKVINPANGASITGESGDNIGRGGRKLIYFKDESAHYERPELIEAALADNTRVQIDISSVNGLGNPFHRRRETGQEWSRDQVPEPGRTRVFVMDWRDHPAKDQAWYDKRKAKAEAEGLQHIHAQEVDRNYSAAVDGLIIPAEWVDACVDAHIVLGIQDTGRWMAALDVADAGGDKNALVARKGIVLKYADEWGARDTAVTARRAVNACAGWGNIELQYDCIGVGSGIKGECNNLADQGLMPANVELVPWNAAASPLYPDDHIVPDDDETPLNKDTYKNLKAQGWWELRARAYRTWRMVTRQPDADYDFDTLMSIPSSLPHLHQIKKELSQPTSSLGPGLKLIVDKSPDGTKSPNFGDAVMMVYWPVENGDKLAVIVKSSHRGTR